MAGLIEAREAARMLGIGKKRLYLLGRRGVIPVVRLGDRQVRYSAAALDQWVAAGGIPKDTTQTSDSAPPT